MSESNMPPGSPSEPPPPQGGYQGPPPGQYQGPPPQGEGQGPPPQGGYQGPPPQAGYQAPPPGAPAYGQQPYAQAQPAREDPGRVVGIIGLILSFFTALIGMIVSIIGYRSSKKAGFKNTPALIGIIVGAIGTVVGIVVTIVAITAFANLASQCRQLGPGIHQVNGVTVRCG